MAKFTELSGFTPKQWIATEAADGHKFTLFGGSRGPGKSYFLRWYAARLIFIFKGMGIRNPVVGLFCEDYPTLRDRQINKIEAEFPSSWGSVRSTQKQGLGFHFRGGGMIALRNLDKPAKYQSAEFAAVLIDELTKNTVQTFDILRGSLRWPGLPPEWLKFVAASNPGGIGHLWVKDYFIDGTYPPELERLAQEFAFVPALPDDNPYLDAEYWDMLETLPPDLSKAWRWGEWDVFQGQAFKEWRRAEHVVEPFKIPEHWPRWSGTDWGYSAPFCNLWLTRNPDNLRTYVYREFYQAGLTDPEQAKGIRAREAEGEQLKARLADPSMWTKVTLEKQTRSTYDVYRENGVHLRKADNDRLTGKRRIHDALAYLEDGIPQLQIFSTCKNLIKTLPALPYDEVRVEDIDTAAEDHAYDALRYGLAYKWRAGKRAKPPARQDYWSSTRRGHTQQRDSITPPAFRS